MASRRKGRVRQPAGEELELDVERLVNGPGAMGHAPDGRVVFLSEGLPGERVRAQVESGRSNYLRARVIRVLGDSAEDRRAAPCPVVALCGGCPWQALEYDAQVAAKQEVVLREIERACRERPAEVHPPIVGPQWRARHRIRLAVGRGGKGPTIVGYRGRGKHEIIPIEDCPIAREELAAALPLVRALADLEKTVREVELSVDDRGVVRLRGVCAPGRPPEAERLLLELTELARTTEPPCPVPAGIAFEPAESAARWRAEAGDVLQRIAVAPGMEIGVPLGAFTQVNADLNAQLVATVVEEVAKAEARNVIDLYCGAGNFSLPLAREGVNVFGIDVDDRAIAAARVSASALGCEDRTRFETRVADDLALAGFEGVPDVIVLDPPRTGAAPVLSAVLKARPRVVVYVSCDVATFARDARRILAEGWSFSSLRLIDLTPQTYRAEVLGVFRLTW